MNTIKTLLSAAAVIAASFTVTAPAHADGAASSTCGAWRCGFNGTESNGFRPNGMNLNDRILQGTVLNGPGLILQGPAANGTQDEVKMVPVAVLLANGKIVTLR